VRPSRIFGVASISVVLAFIIAYIAVRLRVPIPTITLLTVALLVIVTAAIAALASSTRLRAVLWSALVVAFLPMGLLMGSVSSLVVNSWRLQTFIRQFTSQAPPSARISVSSAKVGVLTGNGNHCDFVVEFNVDPAVRPDQLIQHFESLPIGRAIPGESSELHMEVVQDSTAGYTLYVADAPNGSSLDFRCT
jgi:hypothetical protein